MREFLKNIDSFDKTENKDFITDTRTGVLLSNAISMLSSFLMFAQIILAVSPIIHRDLKMTPTSGQHSELVNISINVIVSMPCQFLHLDIVDSIGYSELNINNTLKFRSFSETQGFLSPYKRPEKEICFPCFEVLSNKSCCNGCNTLQELYKAKGLTPTPDQWPQCKPENRQNFTIHDKCQIKGKISVNRVKGSFHIAPGRNFPTHSGHYHEQTDDYPSLRLDHTFINLRFGPNIPSASNPLRAFKISTRQDIPTFYSYHMLVTPVVFYADGQYIEKGFEYTVLPSYSPAIDGITSPGIFFDYSFTPYTIAVTWKSRSFREFCVSTGGLLAGLYSIFAFISEAIDKKHKLEEEPKRKVTPTQSQNQGEQEK